MVITAFTTSDKAMFHFTDGGLNTIWLANGYEEVDTPHGKAVSFHDLDGLIKAICIALAEKNTALKGEEFRYLRQALSLSQGGAIGQLMDKTDQAIAKWEKSGEPVPRTRGFSPCAQSTVITRTATRPSKTWYRR